MARQLPPAHRAHRRTARDGEQRRTLRTPRRWPHATRGRGRWRRRASSSQRLDVRGPVTPLTPAVFHILLALASGDRHGYGIMQDIAEHTSSALKMGAGTLYGTI